MVKNLPAMWEAGFDSWVGKIPLEKEMATHSSTLAWRIPWTGEPGGLESMGSQRVGHNRTTKTEHTTNDADWPSGCGDCRWGLYSLLLASVAEASVMCQDKGGPFCTFLASRVPVPTACGKWGPHHGCRLHDPGRRPDARTPSQLISPLWFWAAPPPPAGFHPVSVWGTLRLFSRTLPPLSWVVLFPRQSILG